MTKEEIQEQPGVMSEWAAANGIRSCSASILPVRSYHRPPPTAMPPDVRCGRCTDPRISMNVVAQFAEARKHTCLGNTSRRDVMTMGC
jgi:hypothetical protein